MAKKELGSQLYSSPYILDKFLASGGMNSEVYLIHDIRDTKKKLIAKIIYKGKDEKPDAFVDAYWKESVTSLRLEKKPNLVQTYETFFSPNNDEAIIIQEYVEGISLKDFINKKGFLTPRLALTIFKQILIGVSSLHNFSHQIIHCDLKPENIVISSDLSKVTIIDFGISSVLEKNKIKNVTEFLTTNRGRGTEGYVSPDIFGDKITVQHDFYALGAILYMMLMKEYPFKIIEGDQDDLVRTKRTVEKPLRFDIINISANPTIPVSLENLIFRCLACKPQDLKYRYKDISEIIKDVDDIIDQIDHKVVGGKLLKPLKDRNYEVPDNIVVDRLEKRNPWYQQRWVALTITASALILIIIAIVLFFVFKK